MKAEGGHLKANKEKNEPQPHFREIERKYGPGFRFRFSRRWVLPFVSAAISKAALGAMLPKFNFKGPGLNDMVRSGQG